MYVPISDDLTHEGGSVRSNCGVRFPIRSELYVPDPALVNLECRCLAVRQIPRSHPSVFSAKYENRAVDTEAGAGVAPLVARAGTGGDKFGRGISRIPGASGGEILGRDLFSLQAVGG